VSLLLLFPAPARLRRLAWVVGVRGVGLVDALDERVLDGGRLPVGGARISAVAPGVECQKSSEKRSTAVWRTGEPAL
jgi:hypothetical protein